MLTAQNMKKIFLTVFITTIAYTLCITTVDARPHVKHGTRVNIGAHANLGGSLLSLVVMLVNPSDSPITIKEIKIFNPDGDLQSPTFDDINNLPEPPFTIDPFGSKGFTFAAANIARVNFPPPSVFQVHTTWEAEKPTTGLKGYSVVVTTTTGVGVVSKIAVEGFDIKDKK